jgi:hemoglobin-like flavoprotein
VPLNSQLLRASFDAVLEREAALTPRFYELLFERYPQVRRLFGRNTAQAQQEMLQRALVSVIEHLDDAAWLQSALGSLGKKHVDYGVTDEMYPWVGECLLATMAEILADGWTAEVETAWRDAYAAICDRMRGDAAE